MPLIKSAVTAVQRPEDVYTAAVQRLKDMYISAVHMPKQDLCSISNYGG
jgi:hypothetical protein